MIVTNVETKRTFTTISGSDGKYFARDFEPGRYSVSAQKAGFAKSEYLDVILLGRTTNLDFTSLEFNFRNLFNQKTVRHTNPLVNRFRDESSEMDLSSVNLLKGFNWQQLFSQSTFAEDTSVTTDPMSFDPLKNFAVNPTYKKADLWNTGFAGHFGAKLTF